MADVGDVRDPFGVDVEDRQLRDVARRPVRVVRDQLQAVRHARLKHEPLREDADEFDLGLVVEITLRPLLDPRLQDAVREAPFRDSNSSAMRHIAGRLRQQQTVARLEQVDATADLIAEDSLVILRCLAPTQRCRFDPGCRLWYRALGH